MLFGIVLIAYILHLRVDCWFIEHVCERGSEIGWKPA